MIDPPSNDPFERCPALDVYNLDIVAVARAVHSVNNLYCSEIGDPLSPSWADLTEAQRQGVMDGVCNVLQGVGPEENHNHWMAARIAEGWTYGPVKDFAARTSPCLVPYEELPESQRRKDTLFREVVLAFAKAISR